MRISDFHEDSSVSPSTESSASGCEPRESGEEAASTPERRGGGFSLASFTSAVVLLGLIGGLGYGAYALILDLQRVGFAPLPVPHRTFGETPLIAPPEVDWARASDRHLAAGPGGMPPVRTRDGPISAIDPETSGLFASPHVAPARPERSAREAAAPRAREPGFRTPDGPNGGFRVRLSPEEAALAEPLLAGFSDRSPRILLHATDEAWVRVRDGEAVIYEGILPAGGQYELPRRAESPVLRAGNAGALYVIVEDTPYGPVGTSRTVLKNMSLRAEEITARMPKARTSAVCSGPEGGMLLQAAVNVGR